MKKITVLMTAILLLLSTSIWAKDKKPENQIGWKVLSKLNLKTKKVGPELAKWLDKEVIIKGFLIPIEYSEKDLEEFLLVPYVPSCMHVPPPPENQIVHVKLDKKNKMKATWYPIMVTGKLVMAAPKKDDKKKKTEEESFLPEAFFTMNAKNVKEVK